jgi:hypothetical protein
VTVRWKAVVGYEGFYEVSDFGGVRSLDRNVVFSDGRRRFYPGRPCKLKIGAYGYPLALLSAGMERKKWHAVHRLVLAAFVGPCPEGQEGCHNNGRRVDCSLTNLRYDTRKGNHADKILHGTSVFGAEHPSARLTDEEVAAVRAASGTVSEIAAAHGVSRTHAWNLRSGKRRASISEMLA